MIRLSIILTLAAALAGGGCRTTENPGPVVEAPALPAGPVVPAEIQAVAEKALGSGAEVLAFGDLAHNGRLQALVAAPAGRDTKQHSLWPTDAVLVTRAAVFEQVSERWMEVLRCDEYLKNPKGFLQGAPRTPITGWQLRIDRQDKSQGDRDAVRDFYFTPVQSGKPASQEAVAIRWNPKVGRYQSHASSGSVSRGDRFARNSGVRTKMSGSPSTAVLASSPSDVAKPKPVSGWKQLARLLPYITRFKGQVAFGMVGLGLMGLVGTLQPLVFGVIMDCLSGNAQPLGQLGQTSSRLLHALAFAVTRLTANALWQSTVW